MQRGVVIAASTLVLLAVGAPLVGGPVAAGGPQPNVAGKPAEFKSSRVAGTKRDLTIFGPLTSGGHAEPLDPPTPSEVCRAIRRSESSQGAKQPVFDQRRVLGMQLERIADYVDDVRVLPPIGPVQMHHARYKCTIFSNATNDQGVRPPRLGVTQLAWQVFYIDHKHLHEVGPVDDGDASKDDAE